ncbi:hypothetical protein Ahy_B01g051998 isoform A [Arachis hypogaea]|uniref:Uncharacterized protein n=1 Tax=Arachis hypogaea TaxID=3818 RepID=A0A445ANB6_ARAHY|nr:hypothetical protein Ahy_B01g051998 isoform A [Arachis hypogaea]
MVVTNDIYNDRQRCHQWPYSRDRGMKERDTQWKLKLCTSVVLRRRFARTRVFSSLSDSSQSHPPLSSLPSPSHSFNPFSFFTISSHPVPSPSSIFTLSANRGS